MAGWLPPDDSSGVKLAWIRTCSNIIRIWVAAKKQAWCKRTTSQGMREHALHWDSFPRIWVSCPWSWLNRWDANAVKKNVQTYLHHQLDFSIRRRHFELELWLPTYQRWEPLPYDSQFEEVATRYNLNRKQGYWYFMLRLGNGRTSENCGDWQENFRRLVCLFGPQMPTLCGRRRRLLLRTCVSLLTASTHTQ